MFVPSLLKPLSIPLPLPRMIDEIDGESSKMVERFNDRECVAIPLSNGANSLAVSSAFFHWDIPVISLWRAAIIRETSFPNSLDFTLPFSLKVFTRCTITRSH